MTPTTPVAIPTATGMPSSRTRATEPASTSDGDDPRPFEDSSRSRWDDPDDARELLEELGVRRPAWMVMENV